MKKTLVSVVSVLIFIFSVTQAFADGRLLSWSPQDVQGVTEQSFNEARTVKPGQLAEKNLAVKSWADAYLLMVGATVNKDDAAVRKAFVAQITNSSKVALEKTSRLIIWERIVSGEILFEGKGYQADDDLFTVAGRANWILRNITKKNFGHVYPASTPAELEQLQKKWNQHLSGEPVAEYQTPYESAEKGMSELRSPAAIEALIVSLNANPNKTALTKDCLKRIYKLSEIPKEGGPATMCDPDTMTHRYLAIMTGVEGTHDYAWWKNWWDASKNALGWDKEKAQFFVKK